MTASDATISAMWRYPVKSMMGEPIGTVAIGERGLAGDRAYALVDTETGNVASAKHPRRWGVLFECSAAFLEEPDGAGDPPPALITLPDGTTISSDDRSIDDALSRATGRPVRLRARAPETPMIDDMSPDTEEVTTGQIALLAPPGTFFDAAPVHVITTSTLAALGRAYPGGRFSPQRFRPNVLVQSDGDGYVENAWVDRSLTIGADVSLAILLSVPRCVMTTLAQGNLPADKKILQTVNRENRIDIPGLGPNPCVGVYGIVSQPGVVRFGDPVAAA